LYLLPKFLQIALSFCCFRSLLIGFFFHNPMSYLPLPLYSSNKRRGGGKEAHLLHVFIVLDHFRKVI
jgi:hypothetical protein